MTSIDIFLERMDHIVHIEKKPFSHADFLCFKHKGKEYKYSEGTIRNVFSKLRKNGKIESAYSSIPSFHTLSGVKFKKPVTLNHGEDYLTFRQNELLHLILYIPIDKPGIHDIRLRFECKGLWSILPLYSDSDNLIENIDLKSNRDIILKDIDLKDFVIIPTIHKTNTVSVAVACSESPIPLNLEGLAKLTSGLTRVEERLQRVIDEYTKQNLKSRKLSSGLISKTPIPDHMTWIVTMWHFGQDSLTEYTGDRFEISWGDGLKLFRIYSKQYKKNKKIRIRKETQEYPNKSLEEALMEKLEIGVEAANIET